MALVTLSPVFVEAAGCLEKNMSPKPGFAPSSATCQLWGLGWFISLLWASVPSIEKQRLLYGFHRVCEGFGNNRSKIHFHREHVHDPWMWLPLAGRKVWLKCLLTSVASLTLPPSSVHHGASMVTLFSTVASQKQGLYNIYLCFLTPRHTWFPRNVCPTKSTSSDPSRIIN